MKSYYEKSEGERKRDAIMRRRELIWREEEEIRAWEEANEKKNIQARLEVSQPDEPLEKEADEVARKVVDGGDASQMQITSASDAVQTKSEGSGTLYADDSIQRQLDSSKGGGQTMDEATKSEMETKMGADFSGVRIHTDSAAHQMSGSVNAKAFTHGQDIYFKNGNYDPGSSSGKNLLAHELTHTVQNIEGRHGYPVARKILRAPALPSSATIGSGDSAKKVFYRQDVVDALINAIDDQKWDINDYAAEATESEMAMLDSYRRKQLLRLMLEETYISDTDEKSIVRAIKATPNTQFGDIKSFLSWHYNAGTTYYAELKRRITGEGNKKDFYTATAALGYADADKLPELETKLNQNDSDVDSTAALLLEPEILQLSLVLRIRLIKQIGVNDSYVDEEDSKTIVRLLSFVPEHYKVRPDAPLTDKKQLLEQQFFQSYISPGGKNSIYDELSQSISVDVKADFNLAIQALYPDSSEKRLEDIKAMQKDADPDVDDEITALTDTDIAELSSGNRTLLLNYLQYDGVVGDPEERTIIRLLTVFSSDPEKAIEQKKDLRTELTEMNWLVIKNLYSVTDGANYETLKTAIDDLMAEDENDAMIADMRYALTRAQILVDDRAEYLGEKQLLKFSTQERFDMMYIIANGNYTNGTDEETILRILGTFEVDQVKLKRYQELKAKADLSISEKTELEILEPVGKAEEDRVKLLALFTENPGKKKTIEDSIQLGNWTSYKRLYAGSIDNSEESAKKRRDEVATEAARDGWEVDEKISYWSEADFAALDFDTRLDYIRRISDGTFFDIVSDEDESSLVLLISTISDGKMAAQMMDALTADDADLYDGLETVIDGEEFAQFHSALIALYFTWADKMAELSADFATTMADTKAAMQQQGLKHPYVFPWKDPGLLKAMYTDRYDYDVEWEDGKIAVTYTHYQAVPVNLLAFGVSPALSNEMNPEITREPVHPWQMIGVMYMLDESETGGKEGQIQFVPAITLFQLENKQFRHHMTDALSTLGLAIGVGEISFAVEGGIAAFRLLVATADVVLNAVSLVVDSYQDELMQLPGGQEFLQIVNGAFIAGAVGGGLLVLTNPATYARLLKLGKGFENVASVGLNNMLKLKFWAKLDMAKAITDRIALLAKEEDLAEYNAYLEKLRKDGKISVEQMNEAKIAGAKRVEEVVGNTNELPQNIKEINPKIIYQKTVNGKKIYKLDRSKISYSSKIKGEPEALVEADAQREAYAAQKAAERTTIMEVYIGQEADAFINKGVTGTEMSVDVVAINKNGQYLLYEGKGKNIFHALEQLRYSAEALDYTRVVRMELVIPEAIQAGYKVIDGELWAINSSGQYEKYLIFNKPIKVTFTK